ncbi:MULTISPECIES: hypoxanthine-guanine phosphoribosyltransferase [Janthinobacterium]|uniref:Hypoxanthine-guanine phosphoribosyltransferase n=1 Tax=Janthinobacterium violaceinigrum TaxID=2654252 RepID=A0A6I1IEV4_9BURK|nr:MULTISPECIES: hypoxanthine-guanine phosphoribosyltransferase [Janthinobacterium]KAB8058527.1 hypoxanthine-guanine phosphoribosyltransferase [Janthinobacterium sp. FT14W]KAB8065848.1 hypoxanthine-guanine phosphoribosyltransferase [Janthinobacterium violaceinigrum]MCX7293097.1 hypoxanthine-guanine phosphoribosyltransferase [Janthinobacterium sp.]MED5597857.1 hypoxanthine-guanine phosphoribosyltransferase [Janthinobacterium sp. P210006]
MQEFHHNRARDLIKNAELLFDQDTVQASITRMADVLNTRFNAEDSQEFPLVLGVMGGAVVFTGNLLPQLSFPLEFDYIHVSRYGDDDKGGEVVWKVIPRSNVAGRTVIVLDDILDEGETLAHVKQRLLDMGASEVILAVFADKAIGKKKPVQADIVGLVIPNRFVVGFGMDAYGYWRNLPGLWAIKPEDLKQE